MNNVIDAIFEEGGFLSERIENYKPRPSQIKGADRVIDAIENGQHIIIEGPCGYGKTFTYLVGVFERLATKGGTAVIATDGISLQEQLFHKDIPTVHNIFRSIYNVDIKFCMLKGRQNYACRKKAHPLIMTGRLRNGINEKTFGEEKIKEIEKWYHKTSYGDISEIDMPAVIKREITCINEYDCLKSTCPMYGQCFYQTAKFIAKNSDIIVTNYHLLFSDLKIGNKILPRYNILVMDEGHKIPEIFRNIHEIGFNTRAILSIENAAINLVKKSEFEIPDEIDIASEKYLKFYEKLEGQTQVLMNRIYCENFKIDKKPSRYDETAIMDLGTNIPKDEYKNVIVMLSHLSEAYKRVLNFINTIIDDETNEQTNLDFQRYSSIVSSIYEKIQDYKWLLEQCKENPQNLNHVYWINISSDKKDATSITNKISVNYKPIDISNSLFNSFFNVKGLTCILSSATFMVDGNFNFMKKELGLSKLPPYNLIEFIGASPFNLYENQCWILPENALDGNDDEDKYIKYCIQSIKEILKLTNGGALCLFTSIKAMEKAYEEVRIYLVPHKINCLIQGDDKSKSRLIQEFKDDKDSVLFATKSFFTGIDVPGDSLRCLIIDKFPFPMTGDPVIKKLMNIDSLYYFNNMMLPLMIIELKQAIGRLIRTVNDRGIVCILDGRLYSKPQYKTKITYSFDYGKKYVSRDINFISEFLGEDKNE